MGSVVLSDCRVSETTREVMSSSLVWDNHGCLPLRSDDQHFLPQLKRYKDSGIDICSLNIGFDVTPWENAILVAANFRHYIECHADNYQLIESVSDIHEAQSSGRLGVTFDLEGACALNNALPMVKLYYDLGVRWMLFAYNKNNAAGGGCDDDDKGLTEFGRQLLKEMERVGMVVCCTHTGERTSMEIMELTRNPVIFSHSNPRSVWDHYRNISDRAIKACAETDGVIAVCGIGDFIGENDNRTESLVAHIDYLVQLVGPDHVGLGLDYVFDEQEMIDYLKANPEVFPPHKYSEGIKMVCPEQTPEIVEALLERGYTEPDLRKILGQNHLRIAESVWK